MALTRCDGVRRRCIVLTVNLHQVCEDCVDVCCYFGHIMNGGLAPKSLSIKVELKGTLTTAGIL